MHAAFSEDHKTRAVRRSKASDPVGGVVGDATHPVPGELQVECSRSRVNYVLRSSVEDTDRVGLRKHIQGLQEESEDVLSFCGGDRKVQMDTLLKLFPVKKKSSGSVLEKRKLKKLLTKIRAEHETLVTFKQVTKDDVAAKVGL